MPAPAPKRYPWQRKRLRLILLLLLPVAAIVAYAAYRVQITQEVRERIAQLEDTGEPTDIRALEALQEVVPDDQNAALLYQQALQQLQVPSGEESAQLPIYAEIQLERDQPLPENVTRILHELIQRNEPALQLLDHAAALPKSRYSLAEGNGDLSVPDLPQFLEAAKLLGVRAVLAAEQGDAPLAARSLSALLTINRSLGVAPAVTAQLTRFDIIDTFEASLERVLNRIQLLPPDLQQLRQNILALEMKEGIRRALAGNTVYGLDRMTHYDGDAFVQWSGILDRNALSFLQIVQDAQDLIDLPPARAAEEWQKINQRQRMRGMFLMQRDLNQLFFSWAKAVTQLATAQTALAIEEFAGAHGAPPRTLADLPQELGPAPQDPYNPESTIKYTYQDGSFSVYSLGPQEAQKEEGAPFRRLRRPVVSPEDLVLQVTRWKSPPLAPS